MSDAHIIVLQFLHQPSSWLQENHGSQFLVTEHYHREATIADIFNQCKPGLFPNYTLLIILEDLVNYRLIISLNAEGFLTTNYSFGNSGSVFTNERGKEFINFITFED